jgi:hypothetical protein
MRTLAPARLLLGSSMLLASLGLLVVGLRALAEHAATSTAALDGATVVPPAAYVAPWGVAVVLVVAAVHLMRGVHDRVL